MRPSLNSLRSVLSNQETLHDPLGSCRRRADVVARLNAGAARFQAPPWCWALAQHRTPFSQPGHTRRRTSRVAPAGGTARVGWASSPRHRRRSRPCICDQACGRPSLSVEIHVRRAAARRLPYRRAASQRGGGTTRLVADACAAGVAVVKKVAARAVSLRGLRARIDTIAHATRCETGHSCCRAAHLRTACVSCVVRLHTAEWESLASFEGQARQSLPLS